MLTRKPKNETESSTEGKKLSNISKVAKEKLKTAAKVAWIIGAIDIWSESLYEYRMERSVNRIATKSLLTKILEDNVPANGHGLIIYYNPKTGNYDALHYLVDKDEVTLRALMVTSATVKDTEKNETLEFYKIEQKPETEQVKLETPLLKLHNKWSAENYKITGTDGTNYTIVAINTGEKWPGSTNKFLFPNGSEANSDYSILGKWIDTTKGLVNTARVQRIVGSMPELPFSKTGTERENPNPEDPAEIIELSEQESINSGKTPNISE